MRSVRNHLRGLERHLKYEAKVDGHSRIDIIIRTFNLRSTIEWTLKHEVG